MIRNVAAAFALPLVLTAVTLGGVAWNRSAGRGPTVLTDRELPLRSPSDDNSGRIVWIRHQGTWLGGESWLTAEKMSALGFDTSLDPASPDAEAHYGRMLRRVVYIALELDGPAWQAWAREYEANSRKWSGPADSKRLLDESSRLVPVDAGLDPGVLERRYPDTRRHLITRGVVRVLVYTPEGGRPRVAGTVEQLAPDTLYVPAAVAERLGSKRYRLSVRYGRRYEPWIVGVEP